MGFIYMDDKFHENPKVQAVVADDVAAIALWLLARTWANRQALHGYVHKHMPGALVVDKRKGPRWAAVLVKHGMWHDRGDECPNCAERIANRGWPHHDDGYVIHDWWKYDAPWRPVIPQWIREAVYKRDGGRCVVCGTTVDLTLDHIIPWSLGGPDTEENLQVMCRSHNSSKGARV